MKPLPMPPIDSNHWRGLPPPRLPAVSICPCCAPRSRRIDGAVAALAIFAAACAGLAIAILAGMVRP